MSQSTIKSRLKFAMLNTIRKKNYFIFSIHNFFVVFKLENYLRHEDRGNQSGIF